jgi:two-component system OmpR family response regulator
MLETRDSSELYLEPHGCLLPRAMRVLLVEDQLPLLRSLSRALRDETYAVDTASDGEEGLYHATNNDYDVIILDVMLPKIDGWEILRQVRAKEASKKTPVLMLTARDTIEDRVHGLDTGADDYLTKPFELPELLARLRALVRRSTGETVSAIELLGYTLDLNSKQVSKDGETIQITAREYSLIEYLALHRGQVISRTELYDHLFGEEDDTLSNLLDVHVSRIRRKLGKDFITTHRGQGYSVS